MQVLCVSRVSSLCLLLATFVVLVTRLGRRSETVVTRRNLVIQLGFGNLPTPLDVAE
jgi:hypothetical protein